MIYKNKSYNLLLINSAFNTLGMSFFNIVFLVYASRFVHSSIFVSIAEFVILLPFILSAYTGYLADKCSKKIELLKWTSWIQSLLFLGIGSLIIQQGSITTFALIAFIKLISDTLATFKNGLRLPILKRILRNDEISSAFGKLQGINSIMELIGQPLGVSVFTFLGSSAYFVGIINAILYLCSGLVLVKMSEKLVFERLDNQKFNLKSNFGQIKKVFEGENSSYFVVILLMIVFANFIFSGIGPLTDLFMIRFPLLVGQYGVSVLIFNSALSVGMILGSFNTKDKVTNLKIEQLLKITFILIVLFSFFIVNISFLAPVVILMMAYVAAKIVPKINSLIVENVSEENLGQIGGGINSLFTFIVPIGSSFFILLANFIGVRWTFDMVALVCLLVLIIIFILKDKSQRSV
ncbi:MAG: MFS transporter [Lactococcus sp.]